MADSTVTIVGNLTRDPELRFTAGGKGVASFGVAVNRRYQVNGEWQEKVSFFNVTAWDTLGENAAASLTKGTRIMVTGRLSSASTRRPPAKRTCRDRRRDSDKLRWARRSSPRSAQTRNARSRNRPQPPPGRRPPAILSAATKSHSNP
jgi:single-strand DNA-binding protein